MTAPRIYTPEYYAKLRRLEEAHWWTWGMKTIARELGRGWVSAPWPRCLDVGCGAGVMLEELARAFPRAKIHGIDVSMLALEFCRGRGAELTCGNCQALPYRAQSTHLVTTLDVLQHAGDDTAVLKEIHRVLVPGGIVVVRTNSDWGRDPLREEDLAQYRRYSPDRLRSLLVSSGFEVMQLTYANALPSLYGRWRDRRGSQGSSGDAGLQLEVSPSRLLTFGLKVYMTLERVWLCHLNLRLPLGHTLYAVAKKRK